MKKRNIVIILISLFILVASFSIYAAFSMTNSYDGEQDFHKIDPVTTVAPTQEANFTFEANKASHIISYNLKNESQSRNYKLRFYFQGDGIYSDLYNMIFVYQNNKYVGLLGDFLDYTNPNGESHLKINLPLEQFIMKQETLETQFKFELHNSSPSTNFNGLNISFTVHCDITTIDYQKELFVKDSIELIKAIDDINSSTNVNKTIILENDIDLSVDPLIFSNKIINIKNNGKLDLCGHKLTLSAPINVINPDKVEMESTFVIFDSRKDDINPQTNGIIVNKQNLILNGDRAIIRPEVDLTGITITAYSGKLLASELNAYFSEIYEFKGATIKPLGLFGIYNNNGGMKTFIDSTETAVFDASTVLINKIINIRIIIGNLSVTKNVTVVSASNDFNKLLADELTHLEKYKDEKNTALVIYDLYLPTFIKNYNATISWDSSNDNIIDNNGRLVKDQGKAILTATIKINGKVAYQKYYVNILQQDNATRLQYLIQQIQDKKEIFKNIYNQGPKDPTSLSIYELPTATNYKNWANKDLGIEDIYYSVDTVYNYLTVIDDAGKKYVYLNSPTYQSTGRINITAKFKGEVEPVTSTISYEIDLKEDPNLQQKIVSDIQSYLDSIDVLTLLKNSRELEGVKNQKVAFELKNSFNNFKLKYTVPADYSNLFKIVETTVDGVKVTSLEFIDFTYLKQVDSMATLNFDIYVGETKAGLTNTVTLRLPGAITNKNFTHISSNLNLFKSLYFQTLIKANKKLKFDVNDNPLTPEKNLTPERLTEYFSTLKNQYLLIDDIEKCDTLMFELGNESVVINSYDLTHLINMFGWAKSKETLSLGEYFTKNSFDTRLINNDYNWIKADGTELLSDGEIEVILAYTQKYPGFTTIWEKYIKVQDNVLSIEDLEILMSNLAADPTFIEILNWVSDKSSLSQVEFRNVKGFNPDPKIYPEFILAIKNDLSEKITNEEERAVIYYLQYSKNLDGKYSSLYDKWKISITRGDNIIAVLDGNRKEISIPIKPTNYPCYDPIVVKIFDWMDFYAKDAKGQKTAGNSIPELNKILPGDKILNNSNRWKEGNIFSNGINSHDKSEWEVLYRYLTQYKFPNSTLLESINTCYNNNNFDTKYFQNNNNRFDPVYSLNQNTRSNIYAMVNSLYETKQSGINPVFRDFNTIIEWATNTANTKQPYKNITISNKNLLYNDYLSNSDVTISYDEYVILHDFYTNNIITIFSKIMSPNLYNYYKNYYWNKYNEDISAESALNMSFTDQIISVSERIKMIESLGGLEGLKADYDKIVSHGKPIVNNDNNLAMPNDTFDNLFTVSKTELEYLLNKYKNTSGLADKLKELLNAFNITNNSQSGLYEVSYTNIVDRELTEAEVTSMKIDLNYDVSLGHLYIPISKITLEEQTQFFGILGYYSNLIDLTIRGNKTNFLFENPTLANNTGSIIVSKATSLKNLDFSYTSLSNIKGIEILLELETLDLRGNGNEIGLILLEDISPLLLLADNKANNNKKPLSYLNVSQTNVDYVKSKMVLSYLFNSYKEQNNNEAMKIYYTYNGVQTLYKQDDNKQLISEELASLLKEISSITTPYLNLPSIVTDGVNTGRILWFIKEDNNNIITIINNKIRVNKGPDGKYLSGNIVIGAQVQLTTKPDDNTIRYFSIKIEVRI